MKDYKDTYFKMLNGINTSDKLRSFITRLDNRLKLFNEVSDEKSNNFLEKLEDVINSNIDFDLIDDTFMDLTKLNKNNLLYFPTLVKVVYMPESIKEFGVYMENFSSLIFVVLLEDYETKTLMADVTYDKLFSLYKNYIQFTQTYFEEFDFFADHDVPILLYGYYYQNNLDLDEVNKVISFYVNNRNYYFDKLVLNGLFFPYLEVDIPKYFNKGYKEIYEKFIPTIVKDYKNNSLNKKRIK